MPTQASGAARAGSGKIEATSGTRASNERSDAHPKRTPEMQHKRMVVILVDKHAWLDALPLPNDARLNSATDFHQTFRMSSREIIVPSSMKTLAERAGYAPAVRVNGTIFCAGQVGRTFDLDVIEDPESQFVAAWENLRLILTQGQCTFDDVVDMTTYHVNMREHMGVFRAVKDRMFPRKTCAWTCIGVAELAHPGLLVEIKCIAVRRQPPV